MAKKPALPELSRMKLEVTQLKKEGNFEKDDVRASVEKKKALSVQRGYSRYVDLSAGAELYRTSCQCLGKRM